MADNVPRRDPAERPDGQPRFSDLAGLPPLYLTAGSDETLLASIRDCAGTARATGVDVTLELGAGMQHAWIWIAGRAPEADTTIIRAGQWVRRHYDLRQGPSR